MPFEVSKTYSIPFTLPDGEHLVVFRTDAKGELLKRHVKQFFDQNVDAKYDFAQLKETHPDEILSDQKALKDKNPSRVMADEIGLDTPNRIITDRSITNPEVVSST